MCSSPPSASPISPEASASDSESALRAELVSTQFGYIRALEALPAGEAGLIDETVSGLMQRRRDARIEPLLPWIGLTDRNAEACRRTHNWARMVRLLDYVLPGDRVVDCGAGFGYVAGMLLRNTELTYYHGIDIGDHRVRAAREMLKANDLVDRPASFETRSLYDIDADFMARHKPSLIMVLEVLEHLKDPVAALGCVLEQAPAEAECVFTVPLAGRLETVASHVSFFNAERLVHLCQRLGWRAKYVEPIANRWMQMLVSRQAGPSARALSLARLTQAHRPRTVVDLADFSQSTHPDARRLNQPRPLSAETSEYISGLTFTPVEFPTDVDESRSRWDYCAREIQIEHVEQGLACRVVGGEDTGRGQYGGVRFPVNKINALRLRLALEKPKNIKAIYVEAYDKSKKRCARWTWKQSHRADQTEQAETYVFVKSEPFLGFKPEAETLLENARLVEVFIRIRPGASAGFALLLAEVGQP